MNCPICSGALLYTYRRTEEERGVFLTCARCNATYDRPDELGSSSPASARGGVRPSQSREGSVARLNIGGAPPAAMDPTRRRGDGLAGSSASQGFKSPPSHNHSYGRDESPLAATSCPASPEGCL